jgi:hypothetical protein
MKSCTALVRNSYQTCQSTVCAYRSSDQLQVPNVEAWCSLTIQIKWYTTVLYLQYHYIYI